MGEGGKLESDGSDSILHQVHLRDIIAHNYRKYTDISTRRQLNTKGNSGKIIFVKHPKTRQVQTKSSCALLHYVWMIEEA